MHPWFLGCRRTVRFTHELQELWITSLDLQMQKRRVSFTVAHWKTDGGLAHPFWVQEYREEKRCFFSWERMVGGFSKLITYTMETVSMSIVVSWFGDGSEIVSKNAETGACSFDLLCLVLHINHL